MAKNKKNDATEGSTLINASSVENKEKRKYISQTEIPHVPIKDALEVALAIIDNYGGKPTPPFQVAQALDISSSSSNWRKLSGAAVAYGLTEGGYNAQKISVTDLGRRILKPVEEGQETAAIVEAIMKPKSLNSFFSKYNNSKFPKDTIAENVLNIDFNVPSPDTKKILDIIKQNGQFGGIIHTTKTGPFVFVNSPKPNSTGTEEADDREIFFYDQSEDGEVPEALAKKLNLTKEPKSNSVLDVADEGRNKKVFISHGKNRKIVEQIKEILKFGQFETIISIEKESMAIPVPEKVFADMRLCGAAIIHIESEEELMDKEGKTFKKINENVLIEIGAAIALYEKRFVLLCEKSLTLPSNLQGLYRCNYDGNELNYESTMKLLKAFNDFR